MEKSESGFVRMKDTSPGWFGRSSASSIHSMSASNSSWVCVCVCVCVGGGVGGCV